MDGNRDDFWVDVVMALPLLGYSPLCDSSLSLEDKRTIL